MRTLLLLLALAFAASPALAQRYTSTGISGVGEGDHFGQQIAVGNLNGGASDILVVSESGMATGSVDREVHVFYGVVAGGLTADDADLVLSDAETDAHFGTEIAVGDLNGDGFDDVVVGVPYNNDRVDESGAAYVYCGSATPDATRDRVLYGRLTMDNNPSQPGVADEGLNLGQQVEVGDVNGDGFDDVVAGGGSTGTLQHEYHVYLGGAGFCSGPPINAEDSDATLLIHAGGISREDLAVGDVNGDIYADIVIVDTFDWYHPSANRSGGALFAFHSSATLPALRTVTTVDGSNDADTVTLLYDPATTPGDISDARFENDVAVGDLDGDGVGDIAVASVQESISGGNPSFQALVNVFDGVALPAFSVRDQGEFSAPYGDRSGRVLPPLDVEVGLAGGLERAAGSVDDQVDLLIGGFIYASRSDPVPSLYFHFGPFDFATGSPADRFYIGRTDGSAGPVTTAPLGIPTTGCPGLVYGVPRIDLEGVPPSTQGGVHVTACNPLFVYPAPPGVEELAECTFNVGSWERGVSLCNDGYFELAPGVLPSGVPMTMSFTGLFIPNPDSLDAIKNPFIDVWSYYDINLTPDGCTVKGCATFEINDKGIQNAEFLHTLLIEVTSPLPEITLSIASVDLSGDVVLTFDVPLTPTPPAPDVFGSYDLYVTLPNTSSPVQISSIPNHGEFNPAWAPFGTYLVHDAAEFGPGDTFLGQNLWVTNASTGTSSMLPGTDGGNDADWWPYGALIAYDRAGDLAGPDETIYLSAAWGGPRYALRADALDPSWSPNGRYLAFHQPSDGSIRAIDVFTGRERIVVKTGQNPAWSPNGRSIAYSDGDDLYRIRVRATGAPIGSPVAVTSGPERDSQPSWDRFGEQLAYQTDATGAIDIWTVGSNGGAGSFLVGDPSFGDFDPAVFPAVSGIVAYSGYTAPTVASRVTTQARQLDVPRRSAASLYAEADVELAGLAESVGLDASAGRQLDAWIAATLGSSEEALELASETLTFNVEAYPNPASTSATVRVELADAADVEITVVDVLGRAVARLADGPMEAGRHTATWDVALVPPGVYVIRVRAGEHEALRRITVAR